MCIYCTTNNYRKIYEHHHGPIPKDEQGRSYDIHHIDGNHNNNDPSNLKSVSVIEHLEIHMSQEDWGACMAICKRLKRTPEEISHYARQTQLKLVEEGTHHFLDKDANSARQRKRVEEGTHHLLDGTIQRNAALKRFAEGTHHLSDGSISRKTQLRRIEEGTHHFLDSEWHSKESKRRIENGTHNFLDPENRKEWQTKILAEKRHNFQSPNHMSGNKIKVTCPHCNKTGGKANMGRWHFDKCKLKT